MQDLQLTTSDKLQGAFLASASAWHSGHNFIDAFNADSTAGALCHSAIGLGVLGLAGAVSIAASYGCAASRSGIAEALPSSSLSNKFPSGVNALLWLSAVHNTLDYAFGVSAKDDFTDSETVIGTAVLLGTIGVAWLAYDRASKGLSYITSSKAFDERINTIARQAAHLCLFPSRTRAVGDAYARHRVHKEPAGPAATL